MIKKHFDILIIILTVLLFISSKALQSSDICMLILKKTTELLSGGLVAWLFSGFIYMKVQKRVAKILSLLVFAVALYAVPTYTKILVWCCETSKLPITAQLSVANYIFLNKTFNTCILRTFFWMVFYVSVYILRKARSERHDT